MPITQTILEWLHGIDLNHCIYLLMKTKNILQTIIVLKYLMFYHMNFFGEVTRKEKHILMTFTNYGISTLEALCRFYILIDSSIESREMMNIAMSPLT